MIIQCWTNGTVILQYGTIKVRHNIRRIKPYISDTNIEDITTGKCVMMSTYYHQLFTSILYILKLRKKVNNWIRTYTLTLIHIGCAREFFHDEVILFTWAVL